MAGSQRRRLRKLAAQARAVLLEQAERSLGLRPSEARAVALDTWVLLIASGALANSDLMKLAQGFSAGSIKRAYNAVRSLLARLLGPYPSQLRAPIETEETIDLFKLMVSDEIGPFWLDLPSLGWAYQYFIEPDLEAFRSQSIAKVPEQLISARTQQFTDAWVAQFLVENTLGRLWLSMHPDSRLAGDLAYLVPLEDAFRPESPKPAREINILDPSCGTMNFGLCAFDLLNRIYREELDRAGSPGWPREASVTCEEEISRMILKHNLFGIDIDLRVLTLAAVALFIKAAEDKPVELNLICGDTLRRTVESENSKARHIVSGKYDVVLLNPPYLDRRDYDETIKAFMKRQYPLSGRNFYTAFLERSLELAGPTGRIGTITPQTFMFISSFERLRRWLGERATIETLVHTGLNTFNDAIVDCAFYVLRHNSGKDSRDGRGRFFRLTELKDPLEMAERLKALVGKLRGGSSAVDGQVYWAGQRDFAQLPGRPWVYWATPTIRSIFKNLTALSSSAEVRQGLATTDNFRFLRFWWEVPGNEVARDCRDIEQAKRSAKTWFPYAKGGGFKKWYGHPQYLVNWARDGAEIKEEIARRYPYLRGKWQWVAKNVDFYFKSGLSYSYLTSRQFSARVLPAGFIFDVAGSAVFAQDPSLALAVLNSRFCRFLLGLINPTVNFQIGDLARLPMPKRSSERLTELVGKAVVLSKLQETFDETSPDFVAPLPWDRGQGIHQRLLSTLTKIENEIDEQVYELYGVGDHERNLIERDTCPDATGPSFDRREHAYRWVSYAIGIIFGRFTPGQESGPGSAIYRTQDFELAPIVELSRDEVPRLLQEYHCAARVTRDGAIHRFDRTVAAKLSGLTFDDVRSHRLGAPISDLAAVVGDVLEIVLGPNGAEEVLTTLGPDGNIEGYLERQFFRNHTKDYHHRPIYLVVKGLAHHDPAMLYYHDLDRPAWADMLARSLVDHFDVPAAFKGPGLTVDFNDGILLNTLPYRSFVVDTQYRQRLEQHWERLVAGEYSWSSLWKHIDRLHGTRPAR